MATLKKFKITHIPTKNSVTMRVQSKGNAGLIDSAKDIFYSRYDLEDEDDANYLVEEVEIKVVEIPEPQKIGQLLQNSSVQLPISFLRGLTKQTTPQKPVIEIPLVISDKPKLIQQPKPIIIKELPISIKKGDKVELVDGRIGYIVKYSSNKDIKLYLGQEINQEQYNKNIHPFDIQVEKENIKNKI